MGLRRPDPAGLPIAKNVFQLPPAAFRTFGPLFLLHGDKNWPSCCRGEWQYVLNVKHHLFWIRHLWVGRSSTVWKRSCRGWVDPWRSRGAWERAWASSRDSSLVDTKDLGLVRDCRAGEKQRGVEVRSGQNEDCEGYGQRATAVIAAVIVADFILKRKRYSTIGKLKKVRTHQDDHILIPYNSTKAFLQHSEQTYKTRVT